MLSGNVILDKIYKEAKGFNGAGGFTNIPSFEQFEEELSEFIKECKLPRHLEEIINMSYTKQYRTIKDVINEYNKISYPRAMDILRVTGWTYYTYKSEDNKFNVLKGEV